MKYRREIDGLRAVAVLPVILFHAGFGIFSGGYVGVDVFFVISGYLITSILINELEQDNFSLARFYERRARRILPALFVVMFSCLPLAYMWMTPSQLVDFSQSLIAVIFFASNVLFWHEEGYFAAAAELKPLLHTWSLAVEEQYYLIFPVLLIGIWRFTRRRAFWIVVVLATFSLFLAEWGWRNMPSANFYLAPTRAWELLAGSICAFMTVGKPPRSSNALSALGLAMIVFAIFAYDEETPFPSFYTLSPVVGTAFVILFAAQGTWVARLLSLPAFVGIGLISYSAYMWHQPIFAFARLRSLSEPGYAAMAVLAIASLLLAWATWHWIEQPFRKRAHPLLATRGSVFATSALAGAAFVVIGVAGYVGGGFNWRLEAGSGIKGDYGQLGFHQFLDEHYVDCEPYSIAQTALEWDGYLRCKQTRPGIADVVLLGDSHAEHLFLGVAKALGNNNVVFYIKNGLPLASNPLFRDIFNYLLTINKTSTVVISIHYRKLSDDADLKVYFERELSETIRQLQAVGHKVALVQDIPRFSVDPESCLLTGMLHKCSIGRDTFMSETKEFDDAINNVASMTGVEVFSFSDSVCGKDNCDMFQNNTLIYRDKHHLNLIGSEIVGRQLGSRILQMQK